MYILKNAWKSIVRNKGRNILIMIIALVIAVAACISLSIRQAAETAKETTLAGMSISAQISYDRSGAMEQMKPGNGDSGEKGGSFNRGDFDFEALMGGGSLTLEEYMQYVGYLGEYDNYFYTVSASLNATGDVVPYGEEEGDDTSGDIEDLEGDSTIGGGIQFPDAMGGGKFHTINAMGDFSITGYSSINAMTVFGADGTHSITDGSIFDFSASSYQCMISSELAAYNNLSVGDTLVLSNPQYEDETYTLTITGIYTNSASSRGNSMFAGSDPANSIYMNAAAVQAIVDASAAAGNEVTDDNGNTSDAAMQSELAFTYLFSNVDAYEAFSAAVVDVLPENYTVSSNDLEAFENSLTPLNTLSTMTGWFFLVVLIIGGIILVVFNIFNLRDRKYEVGVLTAIGMKKGKVALQFVTELFIVTFVAIMVGTGIGAVSSVPITNSLLEAQIEEAQDSNEQLGGNFGMSGEDFGNMMGGMQTDGMGVGNMPGNKGESVMSRPGNMSVGQVDYVDSVSSATNMTVVLQLVLVGLLLTVLSSAAAMITIMRYEPLKILSDRS